MALLASCWLIIEYFIIPDGFLKWFYLSFYIHPFFLIFCQVFLWLEELRKLLLFFLCFLFKITCSLSSFIFGFMKRVAIIVTFSFTRPTEIEIFYDVINDEILETMIKNSEIVVRSTCISVFELGSVFRVVSGFETKEEAVWYDKCKDSWLNEFLNSDHYNSSPLSYDSDMTSDQESICETESSDVDSNHEGIVSDGTTLLSRSAEIGSFVAYPLSFQQKSQEGISDFVSSDTLDTSLSLTNQDFINNLEDPEISLRNLLFCDSGSAIITFDEQLVGRSVDQDIDSFYHNYTQRMRFFDVLYEERLYGINEISKVNLTSPNSFFSMESPISYSSSKMETKMIVKSLECDLELVCVAQACLSWEALHYQYRKIDALSSNSQQQQRLFCTADVSEKFQKYQILLERFMEDEKSSQGKRNPNYMHRRCQFQVPDVKVCLEECDIGQTISADELLEAIEKCIRVFWIYIQTDTRRSLRKFKDIFRPRPPVEDPRDLELLYDLIKSLHKKERFVKELQGKKRCLLRRKVKSMPADSEIKDVLFTTIDLKLVKKVLKMSIISRSHLIWCQEKLNNIELEEGKLYMDSTTGGLFPSS